MLPERVQLATYTLSSKSNSFTKFVIPKREKQRALSFLSRIISCCWSSPVVRRHSKIKKGEIPPPGASPAAFFLVVSFAVFFPQNTRKKKTGVCVCVAIFSSVATSARYIVFFFFYIIFVRPAFCCPAIDRPSRQFRSIQLFIVAWVYR